YSLINVWLIAIAAILILCGVAVAAYYFRKPAKMEQQVSPMAQDISSSSLVEFSTAFGYKFSYPRQFRLAQHEMQHLLPDQIFVSTIATEDQEQQYLEVATTTNEYTFFPNETLFIRPVPMSFEEFKTIQFQQADPQWQKAFRERTGREYPTKVDD